MPKLQADSAARLDALEAKGLRRSPRQVTSAQGPRLTLDGRDLLCFCSNDYLGLANHPELQRAGAQALTRHGSGAAASRLISGNMAPHVEAERRLAEYTGFPAARLFSTGYAANVGALQALLERGDLVFSDALNHASLIDGCRLSRAQIVRYPHADTEALERLLAQHRRGAARAFIVTDAAFSMDGDLAPLAALRQLANQHDAYLYVDEAHSLGVLGPAGRGACAAAGVRPDVLLGTLGKAFGIAGAFVATDPDTSDWLYNRARSFVFSTGPQPALAAQILAAVELVEAADGRRARVLHHATRIRSALKSHGLATSEGPAPIVPVVLGSEARALAAADALLDAGIFVSAIRPPTVPAGTSRLRIVPTAAHEDADIDELIAALPRCLA